MELSESQLIPNINTSPISTNSQQIFEGPEKKLQVSFYDLSSTIPHLPSAQNHKNAHDCSIEKPNRHGLRTLEHYHIEEILTAAACTILSVVSNDSFDAYLLSESSLFISDLVITIKTCGTTTLLCALPVILRIAQNVLGLSVAQVQFSRVSYIFPRVQRFPHDSFANEMQFLRNVLPEFCARFSDFSHNTQNWYLYVASCSSSKTMLPVSSKLLNHAAQLQVNTKKKLFHTEKFAFEVNMFDLNPDVMKQFMFHDRNEATGKDPQLAITHQTGIIDFVGNYDAIDSFNFDPCGYSMNALDKDTYITMHITPESEASYVSYERTGSVASFSSLLATLVRYFRPGRFTVSLLSFEPGSQNEIYPVFSTIINPFGCSYQQSFQSPQYFQGNVGCSGIVLSFHASGYDCLLYPIVKKQDLTTKKKHLPETCVQNAASTFETCVQNVASTFHATKVESMKSNDLTQVAQQLITNLESGDPCYMVNLSQVAENYRKLYSHGIGKSIRFVYSVACNPDKGILTLLGKHNINFEACNADEVQLLLDCKVPREKIVMVTMIVTGDVLEILPKVGTFVIFQQPSIAVQRAIKLAGVKIEIRPRGNSINQIEQHLDRMLSGMRCVTTVALEQAFMDFALDSSSRDTEDKLRYISTKLKEHSCYGGEDCLINIGDCWYRYDEEDGTDLEKLIRYISILLDSGSTPSIDISRGVLCDSVNLGVRIIGRRSRRLKSVNEKITAYNYYLNDGVYGAFSKVLMEDQKRDLTKKLKPVVLRMGKNKKQASDDNNTQRYLSTLFGPTCDALDRIWTGKLETLNVGDWMLFKDMGSYSISTSCGFNGFGNRFDIKYYW